MQGVTNTYYQSKVATVRDTVKDDCFEIAKRMRKSDIEEIWSSNRVSPLEATLECLGKSTVCMTIERNGFPVAMFGIVPQNFIGTSASIWLLSTDGIKGIPVTFIRNNRAIIKYLLTFYPLLFSYVDLRNTVSVKWLEYIGAKWGEVIPYGVDKMPSRYFYFEGK